MAHGDQRTVLGKAVILGEKLTVQTPNGIFTQEGVEAILTYLTDVVRIRRLRDIKANQGDYSHLMETGFPAAWEWQWKVEGKGEYVGTFTKRLAKYSHNVLETDLSPEQLQAVGELAKRHTLDGRTFVFEFSDDFHWEQGAFGDVNWKSGNASCLWGEKKAARYIMENEGGLAIRFYRDAAVADSGYARAFLANGVPVATGGVLWNGYGFEGNSTLIVARLLALWAGLSYKKINLYNNGRGAGSTLNINSDCGYMLAPAAACEAVTDYDLNWGHKLFACAKCKRQHRTIGALAYHERLPELHELRCVGCMPSYCAGCSEVQPDGDTTWQEVSGVMYCPDCIAKYWKRCTDCQQWKRSRDVTVVAGTGRELCAGCYGKRYVTCRGCADTIERPTAVKVGSFTLCQVCKDVYTVCDQCNALVKRAETAELNGSRYCPTCQRNLRDCVACGKRGIYSPFHTPLCLDCKRKQGAQQADVAANFYAAISAVRIVIADEAPVVRRDLRHLDVTQELGADDEEA